MQTNKPYSLIDHTSDIGIKVKGKDRKELFANAAGAMFDIIAQTRNKKAAKKEKIRFGLKADNLEELLVCWLNELLALSFIKGLIFRDFKINKLDENSLKACVSGEKTEAYVLNTEIKAATYCELKIKNTPKGWQANVIFDL